MPLSLDEVEDLIDSWELDPGVDTVVPAAELLATMSVGDPGRIDVLQVIADHQAMRGETDRALATLDQIGQMTAEEAEVVQAMRACFLAEAQRDDEADLLLRDLRKRGSRLPSEAIQRIGDTLGDTGRPLEAVRWFTIALRDLDPQHDLPDHDEEYALTQRMRLRQSLGLPPDQYDLRAAEFLEERRSQ